MLHVADEISGAHPALAGHFPGNPVVPGVVILGRVCRAVAAAHGAAVAAVPLVKFHAPLRPAEPFDIGFEAAGGESVSFRVVRGATLIAAGTVRIHAAAGVVTQ